MGRSAGRFGSAPRTGSKLGNKPAFDLLARPRHFSQERQAGFDRGIELEAPDRDAPSHLAPPMSLHQLIDDAFQRDAVQRILRMIDGL